jgi:hypothetical protein
MVEHLNEIRIDGDDLDDVLLEIERSFGISLPHDLMHVHTAGDLFAEIRKVREPDGLGDRCDTAMSFFLLRRMLTDLGLQDRATPRTPLGGQGLPSPRRLARFIRDEMGLEAPGLVVSRMGCSGAIMIFAAGIGFALTAWSPAWLAMWLLVLPVLALDPGGWEGDWKTLGSLARSVAVRNVAHFAGKGARNREADWWRSFSHLIAGIVVPVTRGGEIEPDQIRPKTRFKFN